MTRWIVMISGALVLSGCGHRELTAPCEPVVSLAAAYDCGPERPINVADLAMLAKEGAG